MQRWDGLTDVPSGWGRSVVTIGVFDGVHQGHQRIVGTAVRRARELGVPAVVTTFDRHPEGLLTGREPAALATAGRKAELLAALDVDVMLVIPFTREFAALEPEVFARDVLAGALHAREVVVGANFRFGRRAAGDVGALAAFGAELGFSAQGIELAGDGEHAWSSTYIRERVDVGDVAAAAAALGRPHAVEGMVVHGDGRGRSLGYPTANVPVDARFAVPADGVYAGWLRCEACAPGERMPAAISVGTNPTFEGVQRRVEAYVLDRELDLYDEQVLIEFGERLRGMVRFDSVDALIVAMDDDVARTRAVTAAGQGVLGGSAQQ